VGKDFAYLIIKNVQMTAEVLTGSEDLRQDTFVMRCIDLIRRLSDLVLGVQQSGVLRVSQQEVRDTFTATPHRHVQRVIPSLSQTDNEQVKMRILPSRCQ